MTRQTAAGPSDHRPAAAQRASGERAGAAGLGATALSIAATFTVAVLGPSVMEPALPGRPGQPPWSVAALPSPYLVVALTAVAIVAGTAGLALTLRAIRRGWSVSPWIILGAGIAAAAALALVPPFGTSDHLSYAAYGRMVVTGHNPYTTTPAALARLGDPVARAVQDWRTSPSVYGSLATGGQVLASSIGGASVRLTVFVLSLLNVAAFAATGLLLHWLARGDRARQLRAALLWTGNPLLLLVLIAGAHVDSQAIICAVGALAVFSLGAAPGRARASAARELFAATGAGALIGLGFAVKATTALVGAGLAIGCLLAWRTRQRAGPNSGWRRPVLALGGLAAGFGATAGASLAYWGASALEPALREGSYVSIGSPWRSVRAALGLATGAGPAEDAVKAAAVVLALALLALLLRSISAGPDTWPLASRLADSGAGQPPAGFGPVARTDRTARVPGAAADAGADDAAGAGARADAAVGAGAAAAAAAGADADAGAGAGAAAWGAPAVRTRYAVIASFAVVFAWLLAWPYVLPWYDGLGWALLALLPCSRLDWLMLARTAALAVGYLPGRTVVMPADLGWLRTVVRGGVTPVVLLAVTVALVVMLWPRHSALAGPPATATPDGHGEGAVRSQPGRLAS